ncbi:related to ROD1 - O-dinitrobenzene,calcium and zinc resistance protein [Cephalotrichum gorgonifer]|uniref:Related to ROD1 - O-dinitrobenzene,calcium and zinc resistance protein n=1 Tax=Cephalotrichum gorgonifer TaxID=2041049 RepID=A0AAE8SXK0_9PEZI|nr:related to ROD1 - O-dinitrobenzene,calcium and zinc resistance protein [Cephalotrichum gorgonifer]
MPKHNMWPLKSLMSGRNAVTLFDIRLENDFIVLRGSGDESAGQLLKGYVVLCLSSALKLDELHLRLTGTLRLSFSQSKMTASGLSQHRVDKTVPILQHRWKPFVGGDGKGAVLQPGNYEFPFEYLVPGDTSESLEGVPEASITYRLKARVVRNRLASDIHTYKHVRIIRTLEPSALEFLHAMSVENIWPNKVEYSIVIPQKAVVFGGMLPLEMRLTPLLKGVELGDITAKLVEFRDCVVQGANYKSRECRVEREVGSWKFGATPQHWHDMIEDTGQEGWVIEKKLDLPKKLSHCVQDMTQHGIKIRHKVKLTVALKNPDGHISELRATLPVSIFISPNIPLDEEGNLAHQTPGESVLLSEEGIAAPPGYGQHVLDQIYEDVVYGGFQTPEDRSGTNSPYYLPSAITSSEDLTQLHDANGDALTAALAARLQRMTDARSRRNSVVSLESAHIHSEGLSRQTSNEGVTTPSSAEHIDDSDLMGELNKVPSYATALKTPARPRSVYGAALALPMYEDIESEVSDSDDLSHTRPPTATTSGQQSRRGSNSRPPLTSSTRPRRLSGSLVRRLSSPRADQHVGSRAYIAG